MDYPTEKQAQERTLALILGQKYQVKSQIEYVNRRIAQHARRRLIKLTIGIALTSIACFYVGRELYLYFFWF